MFNNIQNSKFSSFKNHKISKDEARKTLGGRRGDIDEKTCEALGGIVMEINGKDHCVFSY